MNRLLLLIFIIFGINEFGLSQVDSTYQNIEEVIVSSEKEKTIAFEDPKYYIIDFTVSENQTLLLMKNLGTYYLYALDENMNFRHKLKLKMNAKSLFEDCFGNTHIVSRDSFYFVLNDSLGLFLTETHPKRRYVNVLSKCVGTTSNKFVFFKRSRVSGDLTYYTLDADSGYTKDIYEITESTIAKSMVAHRFQNIVSPNRYLPKFLYRPYSPPEYNPLFVVDDTIYIFNHAEGRLDQLDEEGNLIRSKKIDYQFRKGWKEEVHFDKVSKKFYAAWMQNGVQHLIGLGLAEDEQDYSAKITKHIYPEKVSVRDGFVYYSYKPNYDANLNKFYRQKL